MTNNQALGYMIIAARALNLDKEVIQQLEAEMKYQMDMITEQEAENIYKSF